MSVHGSATLSLFYKRDSEKLRNLPDVITTVSGRVPTQSQGSPTHRPHSTHPGCLQNQDSWQLLLAGAGGGGWSQVGLWQTASHSHLSQLGFCLSLQSDPSPAGNQEPLASCPALHSAELAEPILPAGVLGGPPCTQILSLWCRLSTLPVLCLP